MSGVALGLESMATRFELILAGDDPVRLRAAGEEALREIERIEALLSRYRPSSAIAQINAGAGGAPVRVDPRVVTLLRLCADLSRLTDGAFDVTVGPLLRAWGFVGGSGAPPDPAALARARRLVGMDRVELDAAASTVRLAQAGMELDLGAVGKGYAIDRAIAVLEEHGVPGALLHGGTSSVHVIGQPASGTGWRVAWRVPGRPDRPRALTAPRPALSVSARHGKAFVLGDRLLGHVLDPRRGEPVFASLSACVVGPTSTLCDALSTALLVKGAGGRAALAERFPGYSAWVVAAASDRSRRTVKMGSFGAPGAGAQVRCGPARTRPGSRITPRSRLKTPSTAIPTSRNGKRISQTSGYRTRASKASGQHRMRRTSQSRNFVKAHLLRRLCSWIRAPAAGGSRT